MKFKVKDMNIATGSVLVAVMNEKDAFKLDIHSKDRVKIIKGKKIETVVVDIAESCKTVPQGRIGLFEEVLDSLKAKNNDTIRMIPARKPLSIDSIKKKLDGKDLTKEEINQIVWDIVHNKLDSIELTYFVAAGYTKSFSMKETKWLTEAMVSHGDILKISKHPIIDKHCIGGIPGNRTTMVIVPILAAAGLAIPKTSSRSITSPAGTADTMEVLCDICVPLKKMKAIVKKINGCIVWGGAMNLAPADDKIIKVEYPLGIDAESQLLASIMAKKLSVSSTHILIDIPVGKGAKVESMREAKKLKHDFEKLGNLLGRRVKVIITDGSQPIGNGIGPALEARDVLWLFENDSRAPQDLKKKSLIMAGTILEMVGEAPPLLGYRKAKKIVESGLAYKKLIQIIKAQGARITSSKRIKLAKFSFDFTAKKTGIISKINNKSISKIARIAGAPINSSSGMYLYKHVGDKVKKGERIFTVYAESKDKIEYAKDTLKKVDGIKII